MTRLQVGQQGICATIHGRNRDCHLQSVQFPVQWVPEKGGGGVFPSSKDGGGHETDHWPPSSAIVKNFPSYGGKYPVFSITSALDKGEWLVSGSGLFNLEERASGTL